MGKIMRLHQQPTRSIEENNEEADMDLLTAAISAAPETPPEMDPVLLVLASTKHINED